MSPQLSWSYGSLGLLRLQLIMRVVQSTIRMRNAGVSLLLWVIRGVVCFRLSEGSLEVENYVLDGGFHPERERKYIELRGNN